MNVQVTADLKGLDSAGLEDMLKDVVTIASRNVERRAKEAAPVDTGATRNSIFVDPGTPSMEQKVGPTTEYAPFLEFGTAHMEARAFMIPALEKERAPFLSALAQVYEKFGR